MKGFIYNGDIYLRAIPAKTLFNSTLVHEVVNRGDIFAVRCSDQKLTIVPGNSEVEHVEIEIPALTPVSLRDRLIARFEYLRTT